MRLKFDIDALSFLYDLFLGLRTIGDEHFQLAIVQALHLDIEASIEAWMFFRFMNGQSFGSLGVRVKLLNPVGRMPKIPSVMMRA